MRKRVVEVCVSSDMRGVQWWRARLSSCEGNGVVANEYGLDRMYSRL